MGIVAVALSALVAMGLGAAVDRRRGPAARRAAAALLRLIFYAFVPTIIFFNLVRVDLTAELAGAAALGLVVLAAVGALAGWTGRLANMADQRRGALIVASIQANTGYIGIPVVTSILGPSAIPQAVLYDALVQGPAFYFGAVGVAAALGSNAGQGASERLRTFVVRNPPLQATVLALFAPSALAPAPLVSFSQALVFAVLPLGFFAVGVALAEQLGANRIPIPWQPPGTVWASLLRLVVAPGVLFLIALPLVPLPTAFLIMAASPTGLNSLALAYEHGLDRQLAASAILWSTAVALPVAIMLELLAARVA